MISALCRMFCPHRVLYCSRLHIFPFETCCVHCHAVGLTVGAASGTMVVVLLNAGYDVSLLLLMWLALLMLRLGLLPADILSCTSIFVTLLDTPAIDSVRSPHPPFPPISSSKALCFVVGGRSVRFFSPDFLCSLQIIHVFPFSQVLCVLCRDRRKTTRDWMNQMV